MKGHLFDLAGQTALVTGSSRGLGRAMAEGLAEAGAAVVLNGADGDRLTKAAAEMRAAGYSVHEARFDVTNEAEILAAFAVLDAAGVAIDILVNNAGITRDASFKKLDKVNWDAVIRTNLDSVFNMTKPVCDDMVERGWGRIVNVSSIIASKGGFGQSNYAAAKAGMHGFTKSLALEVARKGVTVNSISPGYIATKMVSCVPQEILDSRIIPLIPVGRLGKPEEVAALVLYLCSQEAAFMTGANIAINGGQHLQ